MFFNGVTMKKLTESKQVGVIYHVCSAKSLLYNLKNNKITIGQKPNKRYRNGSLYNSLSFTRDKRYVVDTIDRSEGIAFQLVLNGNKLSELYPVEPYVDREHGFSGSESEEAVFRNSIDDLRLYLIGINILIIDVDCLTENLKHSGFSDIIINAIRVTNSTKLPCQIKTLDSVSNYDYIPKTSDKFLKWCYSVSDFNSSLIQSEIYNLPSNFVIKKNGQEFTIYCSLSLRIAKNHIIRLLNTISDAFCTDTKVIITSGGYQTTGRRYTLDKFLNFLNKDGFQLTSMKVKTDFDCLTYAAPSLSLTLKDEEEYEYTLTIHTLPVY